MPITAALPLAALLAACGPSPAPTPAPKAADVPSVEELVADPVRLKELRRRCITERPTMGDLLCNRVAEAVNQRFFGDGKVPYTPPKEPPKF
ncbi:MAG: entry exclusion lipoprotein TrbK [Pseudorhodoferax sp.]